LIEPSASNSGFGVQNNQPTVAHSLLAMTSRESKVGVSWFQFENESDSAVD
jgi:hypothetical protein